MSRYIRANRVDLIGDTSMVFPFTIEYIYLKLPVIRAFQLADFALS